MCLIGKIQNRLDEGVSNTLRHIFEELSRKHIVMLQDRKELIHRNISKIKAFDPDVIHYFSNPSTLGFPFAKLIATFLRAKVSVMSALNPQYLFLKRVITLTKPDVIIVQSPQTELLFRSLGCKTRFVPSGVDTNKFKPATEKQKARLRTKYGIPNDQFVVMHVGHIRTARNLKLLAKLQSKDCQVIVVGSLFGGVEKAVYDKLKAKGCIVWGRYFNNIEEIYKTADCYVFPTTDERASIGVPLTVLEAMACNLPVITTPFAGLPRIFKAGNGLYFLRNLEELPKILEEVRSLCLKNHTLVKTRKKVLPYSWEKIAAHIESIYQIELSNRK